ncbi:MAG: hypothetical protein HKN45_07970 [Flavobacteriales bacterium]|nr:hypothetical protein [Flavobacteriales bacterium]NNK81214.1 hypothetical protein [Flavobacteriales bacterium]
MNTKFSFLLGIFATAVILSGCSKDYGCTDPSASNYDANAEEDCCCYYAPPSNDNVIISSAITSDTQWTNDNIYELDGRIAIEAGATLTIQEGTVIKGQAGSGPNASALLIARNAKLIAEGTADLPIIFTSVADELSQVDVAAGNFASPNLDPTLNGLWGGVIVLGNAPISASAETVSIEGIPTTDANGLYGGSDPVDNAGASSLRYISIRHGGSNIGAGNEINGLTLGGVGSSTVIENIEIVSNQDDGVEFFGGAVNASNLIVWNVGDDGIDTDQSWSGTLDNFVVITPAGHCFELDGPEGAMVAGHTLMNGTVIASDESEEVDRVSEDLINTDDNSVVDFMNVHIMGIADGQVINRTMHTEGSVNFSNVTLDVAPANLGDYIGDSDTAPTGITAGSNSQADVSGMGWTWTSQAGKLDF